MAKKKKASKNSGSTKKPVARSKRVEIAVDSSQMKTKFPKNATVSVSETEDGLEIQLEKVQVETIRDQKQKMIQAIGCYNNPGGPSC